MKKGILTTAILTAACIVPQHGEAKSTWEGSVFQSPTGNLICKYTSGLDQIACGRKNDARIIAMTAYGYPREGRYLSWHNQAVHTLYYGEKYRGVASHITCGSYFNGMRCTNWRGHGFFINRDTLNRW